MSFKYDKNKHLQLFKRITRKPTKQGWIQELKDGYKIKRAKMESARLKFIDVNDPTVVLYSKLLYRFTERYMRRVYYRLYPLKELLIYAFITLTVPAVDNLDDWHAQMQYDGSRYSWRRFQTQMKNMGLKEQEFMRCYELTDEYTIHTHIAFMNPISQKDLETLCLWYNQEFGFQKTKLFKYHEPKRFTNKKTGKFEIGIEAQVLESYIHDDTCEPWCIETNPKHVSGSLEWLEKGWDRVDRIFFNYIMKYMLKEPESSKQAVMTVYRVKSYDISKELRKRMRQIGENYKESKREWSKAEFIKDEDREGLFINDEKIIIESIESKIIEKREIDYSKFK